MPSLKELLSQQEKLANDIKALREKESGAAVTQAQELISMYSLTAEQLFPEHKVLTQEQFSMLRRIDAPKSAKTQGNRGPVAAKYVDPKNPDNVWSGRGINPKWMRLAIAEGAKAEDFLIDKPKVDSAKEPLAQKIAKVTDSTTKSKDVEKPAELFAK